MESINKRRLSLVSLEKLAISTEVTECSFWDLDDIKKLSNFFSIEDFAPLEDFDEFISYYAALEAYDDFLSEENISKNVLEAKAQKLCVKLYLHEDDYRKIEAHLLREISVKRIQRAFRKWLWKPYYANGHIGYHARKGLEECNVSYD